MEAKTFNEIVIGTSEVLSNTDREYLSLNETYEMDRLLRPAFEKLKSRVPAQLELASDMGPIVLGPEPQSIVDVSSVPKGMRSWKERKPLLYYLNDTELFRAESLLPEYDLTPETTLFPYVLLKETDAVGFKKSLEKALGSLDRLIDHVITPNQMESVMDQVRGHHKDRQVEYIVFMKGYNKKPNKEDKEMGFIWGEIHILRIFVGEMHKKDYDNPNRRHIDWGFVGGIGPIENLDDGHPTMRTFAMWHDRGFDDSIILLRANLTENIAR